MLSTLILLVAFGQKTHADLQADIDAGRRLSGAYKIDRPVILGPGHGSALAGDDLAPATISAPGTAVLAAWAEPTPPAELWRDDGGLALGSKWKIVSPYGVAAFPGAPPRFSGGLDTLTLEIDCALASWADLRGPVPLEGNWHRAGGPATVGLKAGSGHLWVQLPNNWNRIVPLKKAAPGDRNAIRVTFDRGNLSVTINDKPHAFGLTAKGELIYTTPYPHPLPENPDSPWVINSAASEAFNKEPSARGDMILYSARVSGKAGPWRFDSPLILPARGGWWCPSDAILMDGSESRRSMDSPMIRISDVKIESTGRAGAAILLGYTQHGVRIDRVDTASSMVGLGALGACYPIEIDQWSASNHGLAPFALVRPMAWMRRVHASRAGRDALGIVRGGKLTIDGGNLTPPGSPQSSLRALADPDPCVVSLRDFVLNYEGIVPSDAHLVIEGGGLFPANLAVRVNECTFGNGQRFARLAGKPGMLTVRDTTALDAAPTIDAGAGWQVSGGPVGFSGAVPVGPR